MLGWFSPKCPLGLYEKVWIEWRWRWLGEQFGWRQMLDAQVYALDSVPGASQHELSEDELQTMFRFIAESMGVDLGQIRLVLESVDQMQDVGAAGMYLRRGHPDNPAANPPVATILLSESELADPPSAVSVLAHELAHDLLLGGGLRDDDADEEWLTDLLPVFFGYGIFLANNTIRDNSHFDQGWEFFQITKKGYLSSQMLGHAMALFAWHRQEQKPEWLPLLRLDAKKTCTDSIRFFRKTEDCLVTPNRLVNLPQRANFVADGDLETMSPTQRLGCLWDLDFQEDENAQSKVEFATKLLADPESDIRTQAILVIDRFNDLPGETCRVLEQVMLTETDLIAGIQAILILSNNDSLPEDAFDLLRERLGHPDRKVVTFAALAIGELAQRHGLPVDQPRLIPSIVETAEKAIRVGQDELSINLHPALIRIPDIHRAIKEFGPQWGSQRTAEFMDFVASEPQCE